MAKDNVTNNIKELMNGISKKQFSYIEVSAILNSIYDEFRVRKIEGLEINTKTKRGRFILNTRIAELANKKLNSNRITPEDVHLLKKCRADEYTYRTGRCAYGYKELRIRLGDDPDTGLEASI